MFTDCIIMAGGSGTRLWPASNSKRPKQFLSAPGNATFFNAALDRALAVTGGEGRVMVIAGEGHVPHITGVCAGLGEKDRNRLVVIPEPLAKNTAPAVICGALYAQGSSGEERTILVLTSDHLIRPLPAFTGDALAAAAYARQGFLVVFGIFPAGPATGYGYIETAEPLSGLAGQPGQPRAYRVNSFREKPDRETAEAFLAAGGFYWNSGMFAFSSRFIIDEFRRNAPELFRPFDRLCPPGKAAVEGGIRVLRDWPGLKEAYGEVPSVSFDYAEAEKCTRTVMMAADFEWLDVGSWDEYATLAPAGTGEVYASDAAGCFVDADIPVALCGVKDLIVVVRSGKDGGPPSVLISQKGKTQGVREIVEKIRAAGRTELL
ncbi:MAG: mannose-1-phosphate guanylyltransferase [Spirochaetaceae bacterium]|jgi:mannose-1-phosphate guanylyltransferase/mannose-1-phosphate guanylyltransferase/mannose-6-phosphate isomerase|nr:mannose-1-phosphate guanylyltransferase [Spirochaetaceae bacterium]